MTCGTRWTIVLDGRRDTSCLIICTVLFCERRRTEDAKSRNSYLFKQLLFVQLKQGSRLSFLDGLVPVGLLTWCPQSLVSVSFPRHWSSCLNAHFAPLVHEPFDDHCLQYPLFPTHSFLIGAMSIALSFTQPFSF